MKITHTDSISGNENLIILGKKTSDFSQWLANDQEKNYLKNQLAKEKASVAFNQYNRLVFIEINEEKETLTTAGQLEQLRKAGADLTRKLNNHDLESVCLMQVDNDRNALFAVAEGMILANYQFLNYFKDKDKKQNKLREIRFLTNQFSGEDSRELEAVTGAVYKTRDLVNEPLSYLTAERLAGEVEKMGKDAGFSVEILEKKQIESLKMGGLLAVNKGSIDPPTFSILEYKPADAKNAEPYILVGKGVVFDTGGLSLKPTPNSMDYMKCDMGGAAAVAGAIYAVAKAGLPVHIIGLIPATDNRPDGNAYVPGDVINMYDGTTVEVLNTDAEGRMILADALAWAKQYKPQLVIDLATLTGAAHVAIGEQGMVGMGNARRDIMDLLIESSFDIHERIAEFPFWDDYAEMMKSDIADLKNIGGRTAGAITAGKFLEHFTDYPYIHLDIAGPAFLKTNDSYRMAGGTGVGVRLLYRFFKKISG
ncbi:MAG TPA: leucyl aminopeptidase [Bacteroidales bacterium]|nr:leucyl aminopeptidase [Bacteroidales bacterium]